ncbi:CPBP family intramembrane glutamic endopeptidase [Spirosoma validum]|uniref:CPBP family intramembrane metalloprotease n=1 Tax=Spirosoma validum TaxID=2771355 RepID=A0A927B362_9BACT|nr:type II CAAX endopeptidase family protein [Spirosoma validum]MBD2754471.1 CPBP family intramembrane metalloprotease [Spirosoma validum]
MLQQLTSRDQTATGTYYLPIALLFGIIFAVVRVVGILGPLTYRFVLPLGFILMALMPFIFLNRSQRQKMGFSRSKSQSFYGLALLTGMVAALFCFLLGKAFFDTSLDNWYVTIKNAYANTVPLDSKGAFLIITIPALIFSPVGEEIYFREFLQDALSTRFNYRASVVSESLFFGIIHLCHHGLSLVNHQFVFRPVSGSVWVLLMFLTACLFAWIKRKSDSIYPAIAAHVAFNLTMNVCIFYALV